MVFDLHLATGSELKLNLFNLVGTGQSDAQLAELYGLPTTRMFRMPKRNVASPIPVRKETNYEGNARKK